MESMFQFLPNAPLGKDLFAGQSQEKIATVLAEILQQDKFQIIGIDGGWGVGKSNLVKIVETKLQDKKYCDRFFLYDVWGHQEDEQRKSILVELTEFLTGSEGCLIKNAGLWKGKLKKLLAKERDITTVNMPYLSIGIIVILLSLIYSPLVGIFKDPVDAKNQTKNILLALTPIILLFIIYIIYLIKWLFAKKGRMSFKLALQETIQIYADKKKQETKIETISENEPSVKEFRAWMKEIDNDLGGNKLIIVFDNFDRLPNKNILAMWSSIHIFFSEDMYTNIKVLIPFDRVHIKKALEKVNGEPEDYINKTFDLVYRVSPPILSDWKEYFRGQWKTAFKNPDEDEYIKVEQIYDTFNKTITPRDIIVFINEIVSIKIIDSNIPERYIALFISHKQKILDDPLKAISSPDFLAGLSYLYGDDPEFPQYITALTYQLNPENALEVIYRKRLKDSLINNDAETLNNIAKTNVFDKIISSVAIEVEDFTNPILALNMLDKESKISQSALQAVWDDEIYFKVKKEEIKNFDLIESQKVLLTKISNKYKRGYLIHLINGFSVHKDFKVIEYCKMIDQLDSLIKNEGIDIKIHKLLPFKKIPADEFETFVTWAQNNYKRYNINCDADQLDQELANKEVEKLSSASFVKYLINDYTFPKFENSLKLKVEDHKSVIEYIKVIYSLIKIISEPPIDKLLNASEIYELLESIERPDEFLADLLAMRLTYGNNFGQRYGSFDDYLDEENEPGLAKEVADRISYYMTYGELLTNSVSFDDSTLYQAIVQTLVNNHKGKGLNLSKVLPQFDKICSQIHVDFQTLLNDLTRWTLPNDINLVKEIPNAYFAEAIKSNVQLAKDSIELAVQYFNSLNQDEWSSVFKLLKEKDAQLLLIINYSDWNGYALSAFQECLRTIIKSAKLPSAKELTQIIESIILSGKSLTNIFEDVRDEFIEDRNITPELFIFFSKWLFELSDLNKRAGDVMRTIFVPTLLDNNDCVQKFMEKAQDIKSLIEVAGEGSSADFRQGIVDRFNNDRIKELAEILSIDKFNHETFEKK